MKKAFTLLWVLSLLVTITLIAANFFLGDLNQDEGWYLYGAKLVAQGKMPYIDFAATQGPIMYLVYGAVWPLVECCGVAGGRLFTALLGFACVLCSAWLAARIVPRGGKNAAALIAFMLVGMNVFQSHYTVIVKTYALSALFVLAGFIALTCATGKRYTWCAMVSGLLFALAAGTRTSAGVVIPVVFLGLLLSQAKSRKSKVTSRKSEGQYVAGAGGPGDGNEELRIKNQEPGTGNQDSAIRNPRSVIGPCPWCLLLGAVIGCLAIFLPFYLKAPVAVRFGLLEYHAARDVGKLASIIAYKAGFISRVVQSYFLPIALFLVVGALSLFNKRRSDAEASDAATQQLTTSNGQLTMLFLSALAVTAVHFLAPFPYDDYQVMIFPVFAVAVAAMLARIPQLTTDNGQLTLILLFLLSMASAFSSPVNHKWVIGERDVIWWPLKKECALKRLRRTAGLVKSVTSPGDKLFTQDPYLALETGLDLPEGLELGPFSYSPDMTRKKALACHVLNREMMIDLIEGSKAPVAALSGWSFAIDAPSITKLSHEDREILWNVLRRHYSLFRQVDNFGHAGTTLNIFLRSSR